MTNPAAGSDTAGRHWERLEELFEAAVSLPRDLQEAAVQRASLEDAEVGRQLRALLDCDSGAGERIGRAIETVKAAATAADWAGRRIGPYRIVREIGRGGMGIVFESVRDDDEYRKTVALKIAPWWRDLDLLRERFRHERQILASLEHPNIARFFDGGTHEGVPYFAMEFVEGVPITVYARNRGLKLREKIELFRQVCSAVQRAHQSLVVHRDLKPANILVTPEGIPKLLDFGIARLLGPDDAMGGKTLTGAAPWTPNYASPEQVRALPITTRTDVYSLGLILFELLTGETGQTADTSSLLALDRSVCEMEAPPASQCAAGRGDRALARQLRGDLDTIVATAICKEPERRYNSAAAFSEDLERYLKGLPVAARPGGLAYRGWKLLRRHRVVAAAAVLVLATMAGGVLATAYQARRAERRYQQVRKLANSVLFGVHDRLQNLAGATATREWAVRTALEYLDDLAKDAGADRSVVAELAGAYLKIGDVQGYPSISNLGQREAALASYRKAESIAAKLAAVSPDRDSRRLLARSHQRIGTMLRSSRHTAASVEEFQSALAVAEPLYEANPNQGEDAELLADILITLGQAEAADGKVADASRLWLRAAEVNARAGAPAEARLARTGKYVIRALMYRGDLEAAESTAIEGMRMREAVAAAQPANTAVRRDLANSYGDLAYVYFHPSFLSFDDRPAAARLQEKALAITRRLAAADPNNATARSDLYITEVDYSASLAQSSPFGAIRYARESLAIAHGSPLVISPDGGLFQLADGLRHLGRYPEAVESLRAAIASRQQLFRQDPEHFTVRQQLLRGAIAMAGLLLDSGDSTGALEQSRQAVALAEELSAAIPTNLLARRDLADAYEALGRSNARRDRAEARRWYQKSLDVWTAWPRSAHTGRMDRDRRVKAEALVARCQ
jgi:tetratricopeptide (TPR) repeat protein